MRDSLRSQRNGVLLASTAKTAGGTLEDQLAKLLRNIEVLEAAEAAAGTAESAARLEVLGSPILEGSVNTAEDKHPKESNIASPASTLNSI